jgi:hypothetical protein
MGAFTDGGQSQPPTTQQEEPEVEKDEKEQEPEKFDTDVEGVKADGQVPYGSDRFPMFKVDKNDFYQNMKHGRKRLRFKTGSGAQQYMKGTKYQRPFYVSYTDSKGKTYSRKIK